LIISDAPHRPTTGATINNPQLCGCVGSMRNEGVASGGNDGKRAV
jgi:hypothetical protein